MNSIVEPLLSDNIKNYGIFLVIAAILAIWPNIHSMDGQKAAIIVRINNSIDSGNLEEFKNLNNYFYYFSSNQLVLFQENITCTNNILCSIIKSNYTICQTILSFHQTTTLPNNKKQLATYCARLRVREDKERLSSLEEVFTFFKNINPTSIHTAVNFIRSAHLYAILRINQYNNSKSEEWYAKQYLWEEYAKRAMMYNTIEIYLRQR
jgi:hypothetical protein